MQLNKLISKKTNTQPETLRMLTTAECRHIAGGGGKSCYYSYYSGSSTSYTSNSGSGKN